MGEGLAEILALLAKAKEPAMNIGKGALDFAGDAGAATLGAGSFLAKRHPKTMSALGGAAGGYGLAKLLGDDDDDEDALRQMLLRQHLQDNGGY